MDDVAVLAISKSPKKARELRVLACDIESLDIVEALHVETGNNACCRRPLVQVPVGAIRESLPEASEVRVRCLQVQELDIAEAGDIEPGNLAEVGSWVVMVVRR